MHRIALLLTLALAPTLCGAEAQAESWRSYHNTRFGTVADYPATWTMGAAPENNDGRVFRSPDQRASVTISGIFALSPRAEEFAGRLKPSDGETITYSKQQGDWLVTSGTKGDRIFYRKQILTCKDTVWNDLDIEYPAADKAKYDPLVAHMAASLRAGSGYDRDCK
jgi:hypothetical protein